MKKLGWILFIVFIIIDIVLATWTWHDVRESIGWVKNIPQKTDFKLRHIVQYSPQSFLLLWLIRPKVTSIYRAALYSTLFITGIGILTEVIQAFIPTRIPAMMDVFWNFIAAVIGVILFMVTEKVRAK